MNVLILTDGIHPFIIGGMQKHSHNLAKYLSLSGMRLTLVHCVNSGDALISHEQTSKALFGELSEKLNFKSVCFEFPKKTRFPGHYLVESYQYSKKIVQSGKIKFDEFDVIYIQGFSGWYLLKKLKSIRSKTIINFHGLEMFQKSTGFTGALTSVLLRPFVKINLKRAGYVQSLGGKLTEIITRCGIDQHKIITIPIGIDKKWVRNNETHISFPRKFVFIGRNERRKGFFELMQAFKEIKDKENKFELHIIGPFEITTNQTGIFFHGKITDENKIKELVSSCDILVCPSYAEGMPTVILEGMACGCAIIASDVGATSEEVNDSNGWLIEPGNVKSLIEKMTLAISENDALLTKMKTASISKIRNQFLWENVILRTREHFMQIKNKAG